MYEIISHTHSRPSPSKWMAIGSCTSGSDATSSTLNPGATLSVSSACSGGSGGDGGTGTVGTSISFGNTTDSGPVVGRVRAAAGRDVAAAVAFAPDALAGLAALSAAFGWAARV